MSNLVLRLIKTPPFARETDAVRALSALAEVLSSFSLRGGLWTALSGERLYLSEGTFEHGLPAALGIRADVPEQPTHIFPICFAPQGPTEIGTLSISIRDPAPLSTYPGLSATIELPEHTFKREPAELKAMLEQCVDALDADAAMIGLRSWIRKEQAAWCLHARQVDRDLLPAGSELVQVRTGHLIVAHAEAPASESAAALQASLRVRDALRTASGVRVATAESSVQPSPPLVAPISAANMPAATPLAVPSFMATPTASAPPARELRPAAPPAATLAFRAADAPAESLPFDAAAPAQALPSQGPQRQSGLTEDVDVSAILRGLRGLQPDSRAASADSPSAQAAPPPAMPARPAPPAPPVATPPARDYTETAEVDVGAIARAVLAFGPPKPPAPSASAETTGSRQPGPPAQPSGAPSRAASEVSPPAPTPGLTLAQYASLSVDLELSPAQAGDILRRYGTNEEGKRALDERWAQILRDQPDRRAALEEAKAYYRAWLAGRTPRP